MVLEEYKYTNIIMILVLEVGKQQGNTLILAHFMDVMTIW